MRWFERQRINWISKRKAPFNRQDLMDAFDLSLPQASHDIQTYIKMFPRALTYNMNKKRYEKNHE